MPQYLPTLVGRGVTGTHAGANFARQWRNFFEPVVEYAERTEMNIPFIVVVCKGKKVKGLEPAVVGKKAIAGGNNFYHLLKFGLFKEYSIQRKYAWTVEEN